MLVDIFDGERFVDMVGISKGRGFAGVVKRHHFGGGPKSHGSMFQITGSIGSSAFPSRVFKGMRMSGHMGTDRVTMRNLRILGVDKDENLLVVEGSVPGPNGGYLVITQGEEATPRAARIRGFGHGRSVEGSEARGEEGLVLSREYEVPKNARSTAEAGSAVRENMATIDIYNLSGAKVGTMDLADEVFGAVNEDLLWEAVKHYRAAQRAGTHATKNKKLVSGCGQEAVETEGHRPGARRLDPFATVAAWRHGAWAAAAFLRLHLSAEEVAGCVALGAGCEAGGRQVDRGERV